MFKVKYVDYIMMLVRLDLNQIVSLFQHKCEVSETVSTTTLVLALFESRYTNCENISILAYYIHKMMKNVYIHSYMKFRKEYIS